MNLLRSFGARLVGTSPTARGDSYAGIRSHGETSGHALRRTIATFMAALAMAIAPIFSQAGEFVTVQDFANGSLRGFQVGEVPGNVKPDRYSPDIAVTGANVVRVQLQIKACKDCTEYKVPEAREAGLDLIRQLGAKDGWKVIITLKPERDGPDAEFWSRKDLRASLIATWTRLATKYRDDPVIAGYDLVNEPFPNTDWRTPEKWISLASDLIEAIRTVDTNHVIIVEIEPHARAMGFPYMKPLPYEGLVYSLHFYEPPELTFQGVIKGFKRGSVEYPGGTVPGIGTLNKDALRKLLDPVIQFAHKNNVPIYVGEFSCVRWAPGRSAERWLSDVLDIFDEQKWSWTYHGFREWQGWDPEVESSDSDEEKDKGEHRRSLSSRTMQVLQSHFVSHPGAGK